MVGLGKFSFPIAVPMSAFTFLNLDLAILSLYKRGVKILDVLMPIMTLEFKVHSSRCRMNVTSMLAVCQFDTCN